MTLRGAIGFSAVFHVVLLTAAPSAGWLAPKQKRFEVSYVPARPAAVASVKPQVLPAPPARIPTPALPVPSEIQPPRTVSSPQPAREPVPAPRPVSRPVTRDDVAVPAPQAAAHQRLGTSSAARRVPPRSPVISSLPDKEFVFLDHKEQVRKHLKARLNYPDILSDGTVRLRVILGPEGSFKQAVVLETSDPRLAGLAVKDAQSAAPYPRLPAKFRPRQLRYEFLVRYRPEYRPE